MTDIQIIRAQLRKRGFTGSVTKGQGTGASWIWLRGNGDANEFTDRDKQILRDVRLPFAANYAVIAPQDQARIAERLASNSFAASHETR